LPWCESHRSWLAHKYLASVRTRKSVRPFFGSWNNIHGYIECGYYLGAEVVREWMKTASGKEVATLPEAVVRRRVKETLLLIAKDKPAG
jgi:hypothetical protein